MALATSGTYNTLSITAEIIVRDAFENIGITSEYLDVAKYNAALRSLNFILQEWMSKSYNLWTVQSEYMQLTQGQPSYNLPEYISDIVQINTRNYSRQLNGTPYSFSRKLGGTPQSNTGSSYDNAGGGNAANAFDSNPTTACTQNAPQGNISYDFGLGNNTALASVGIQSNANDITNTLDLVIEGSNDSVSWTAVITPAVANRYYKGVQLLFLKSTEVYRYFRVRALEGLLNIQEIYFNAADGLAEAPFREADIACTQARINGSIGYAYSNAPSAVDIQNFTYPATNLINMVGIQVPANTGDQTYSLVVEGNSILTFNAETNNPASPNALINLGLQNLLTLPSQTYKAGVTYWFDLAVPLQATYIQIRETSGATLNIEQLFFVNSTNDTSMSDISLYAYNNMPQKYQQGRPSCYCLQRNTNNFGSSPLLYLWPVPDNYWNLIQITYTKMMQDVTYLAQGIDVPARFYPALTWALSWRLAMKYKPEIAQGLKAEYEESFRLATIQDSETVPITITISDEAY